MPRIVLIHNVTQRRHHLSFRGNHAVYIFFILACFTGLPFSCQPLDHFLIHPHTAPDTIITWSEDIKRGSLLLHLEWACPPGDGPFPGVLVHPEAGKKARDMVGVIWDLALHGYMAAAVDYRRFVRGRYRETLFPWRDESDVTAAFEILHARKEVDPNRIGVLGFSQGGVFSLLIAAQVNKGIKSVVAYYPITDFTNWLDAAHYKDACQRFIFRQIRAYFRKQSGASSEDEFTAMLRRASPLFQVKTLTASVLLIHGDNDTTAPLEQSRLLYARLRALGRRVDLMIIPGAPHAFNFKNRNQAKTAWQAALQWLDHDLQ